MASSHHAIDYVELAVTNLAAARSFYQRAFGWEFNDYGPAYAGIRSPHGDGEVGGLDASRPPSGGGGVLVLLYSDDLESSLAAVRSAGGTVHIEPYAFPGGRRFHFTDTSGNELGVWSRS